MFESLLTQYLALAGVAALIAAIINVLKSFGWVKDDQAGKWVAGLNLLSLVAFLAIRLFRPELNVGEMDVLAGQIAQFMLVILGYVIQMGGSKIVHELLKALKLPWISKSFTE